MLCVVYGLSDKDNTTLVQCLAMWSFPHKSGPKRHISVERENVLFFREVLFEPFLTSMMCSAATRMDATQMLRVIQNYHLFQQYLDELVPFVF